MRIRTLSVVAAVATTLLAAGCSSSSPTTTPTPGGTLTIWADDQRVTALKPLAQQFGKDNNVTVDVHSISGDLQSQFVTASASGKGPDIVIGAHDWTGNLVQNGTVDPIQLSSAQQSKFAPVALTAVTFNGQLYGVPYAIENVALIRNTDLAPTAPTTLEDLVAQGQALKTAKKVTNIMALQSGQNGDAYHIYPLFSSGGGFLFGKQSNGSWDPKNVGVNSSGSIAAFTKIQGLGEKGSGALTRSITSDNAIPTFTSGKTAFLISGPWAIADIKKAGVHYDITPVPSFAGGQTASPFVGVQAFFVASKGKNKALANEFVTNFVATTAVQEALYQVNPRPPALTDALTAVEANDPDIQKWFTASKTGTPMPNIPAMNAVWGPFGKAEAAIIAGADVKSTLDAAQTAITTAIGS